MTRLNFEVFSSSNMCVEVDSSLPGIPGDLRSRGRPAELTRVRVSGNLPREIFSTQVLLKTKLSLGQKKRALFFDRKNIGV